MSIMKAEITDLSVVKDITVKPLHKYTLITIRKGQIISLWRYLDAK